MDFKQCKVVSAHSLTNQRVSTVICRSFIPSFLYDTIEQKNVFHNLKLNFFILNISGSQGGRSF